jgi:hypothetical protein
MLLFQQVKNKINKFISDVCIRIIRYQNKSCNLVRHAISEFDYSFKDWRDDDLQKLICDQIIDILSILNTQGDSGFSIKYKQKLLNKCINFEQISKLTFSDNEFCEPYDLNGSQQNKRNSAIFKYKKQYSYLNSFIKNGVFYIGEDNKVVSRNGGTWHGGVFVIKKDGSIYYLRKDHIKNIEKFNNESFIFNTYELEYPNGWWLSFCSEDTLSEYKKYYNFKKDFLQLEKEINYKNGIHKDIILEKIELIKKHINKNK